MRCKRARLEFPLLGTGELAPRLEAEVCRHLERCPACRAFEAEERALDSLLATWRPAGARREIGFSLLAAAAAAGPPEGARGDLGLLRRFLWPGIAAGVAAAALAIAPLYFAAPPPGGEPGPTLATAADAGPAVPIGTGLTGLVLPPRDLFRP